MREGAMARNDPAIETIKSIILDFQEARLETGVPRRGQLGVWELPIGRRDELERAGEFR